jgi:hypothetical protein
MIIKLKIWLNNIEVNENNYILKKNKNIDKSDEKYNSAWE